MKIFRSPMRQVQGKSSASVMTMANRSFVTTTADCVTRSLYPGKFKSWIMSMEFVVPKDETVTGGDDGPIKTTEKQCFCHLLEKSESKISMKLSFVLFMLVFFFFCVFL